jgi:hypothetical protein
MNIIALISELKWYHDVATTCVADLTRRRDQQKSGQKRAKRCEEKESPSATPALYVVVQPLQEKLHIMMLLVRLHGCIIYSTNDGFSHPFTISCTYVRKPKRKSGIISNCLIPRVFFFSGFLVVFFFSGFFSGVFL